MLCGAIKNACDWCYSMEAIGENLKFHHLKTVFYLPISRGIKYTQHIRCYTFKGICLYMCFIHVMEEMNIKIEDLYILKIHSWRCFFFVFPFSVCIFAQSVLGKSRKRYAKLKWSESEYKELQAKRKYGRRRRRRKWRMRSGRKKSKIFSILMYSYRIL